MSAQLSVDGLIARYKADSLQPVTPALRALTERLVVPHVDEIIRWNCA